MRALTLTAFGGPENLQHLELPAPTITTPDQVRIRVMAAAINRLDLFVLGGLPGPKPTLPLVVGSDGAGIVESVGAAVTRVAPGDRVLINPGISCGRCDACRAGEQPICRSFHVLGEHSPGTIAEFVVVPEANVAKAPANMPWSQAAAFSLATLTAWRMLATRARLAAGETVLIWGVGGGVSLAAIQIAKLHGARVIATSSSDLKLETAKRLGADVTLNHGSVDVAKEVRSLTGIGADVVVDSVGEKTWANSLKALRPMGRLVTCGATTGPHVSIDIRKLFWFQWNILGSTMGNHKEFQTIATLAARGLLWPIVDSVFPLDQGRGAFDRLAQGNQLGKLVIEVSS